MSRPVLMKLNGKYDLSLKSMLRDRQKFVTGAAFFEVFKKVSYACPRARRRRPGPAHTYVPFTTRNLCCRVLLKTGTLCRQTSLHCSRYPQPTIRQRIGPRTECAGDLRRRPTPATRPQRRRDRPGAVHISGAGERARGRASLPRNAASASRSGGSGSAIPTNGVVELAGARVRRNGRAEIVTYAHPRFLNAEDQGTLDAMEICVDLA